MVLKQPSKVFPMIVRDACSVVSNKQPLNFCRISEHNICRYLKTLIISVTRASWATPGTVTHVQYMYIYIYSLFLYSLAMIELRERLAKPHRVSLGSLDPPRRIAKKRANRPAWSGAERNGTAWPFLPLRAIRRAPGATMWWGPVVTSPAPEETARGARERRELVSLSSLASERAESRSVRVHSPNSASGCDRSYLLRGSSRSRRGNHQSFKFSRSEFSRERTNAQSTFFLSLCDEPAADLANDRTTFEYNTAWKKKFSRGWSSPSV